MRHILAGIVAALTVLALAGGVMVAGLGGLVR